MPSTRRWSLGLTLVAVLGSAVSCSRRPVSRRDVAKYIVQARGEQSAAGCTQPFFSDVPCSDAGWGWVETLRTDGLTTGCDPQKRLYCPNDPVTRAQVAMFAARAAAGSEAAVPAKFGPDAATGRDYSCYPASPKLHFKDVAPSNIFCKHVHYLWAKNALAGAGETYRPNENLSREALDEFFVKDFHLQPATP